MALLRCWKWIVLGTLALPVFSTARAQDESDTPRKASEARKEKEKPATLSKEPVLEQFVKAKVSKDARTPQGKGTEDGDIDVLLSIDIDAKGSVNDVRVLESAGRIFDEAARAAAKQFLFSPAEIEGKAVAVRISYRYIFPKEEKVLQDLINFRGVLRDTKNDKAIAGCTVEIPSLGIQTQSDEKGVFAFANLPPGTYKIQLRSPELTKLWSVTETIPEGKVLKVVYRIERLEEAKNLVDEEETIRGNAPGLLESEREVSEFQVTAKQASSTAGTQGDAIKILQNVPGVARSSFGTGELVVWGASPEDTRVYIDGIEVPYLFHLGGLRSVLPTESVENLSLLPGGYRSPHGRGIGGLVRIRTSQIPAGITWGKIYRRLGFCRHPRCRRHSVLGPKL